MSSHHFVKEGQEPALFVLDALPFAVAASLLEWAPLVLVAESALEQVQEWGIKIDIALATPGQAHHAAQMLSEQAPVTITELLTGESFLTKGLSVLADRGQTAVNILSTTDDVFEEAAKFSPRLQVCILQEHLKWSAIPSGQFEKWYPGGVHLHLRKSAPSQVFDLQGLETENELLVNHRPGLVSIRSRQLFWVGEEP
ncbi:hypothetical protein SAMN04488109_5600 [Chryseolinea serpens]|uniref:Thiamine pyrophosphokinase n=1 Tax=Chryseolinea serpens TaxID=947013 RepID=A0A1M5WDJ7_9BACT|nr:hypothetical protein [Chryseolinea serpens]SHH85497.1 hypothetical protein SAMN04488109_5600 [Chryseolinea serpens]